MEKSNPFRRAYEMEATAETRASSQGPTHCTDYPSTIPARTPKEVGKLRPRGDHGQEQVLEILLPNLPTKKDPEKNHLQNLGNPA